MRSESRSFVHSCPDKPCALNRVINSAPATHNAASTGPSGLAANNQSSLKTIPKKPDAQPMNVTSTATEPGSGLIREDAKHYITHSVLFDL